YVEMCSSMIHHADIYLVYLLGHMADVIIENKSRQKDSDGFMLGARVQELIQINVLLNLEGTRQFNNQEAITSGLQRAQEIAVEIRRQQKELGLSDDAL